MARVHRPRIPPVSELDAVTREQLAAMEDQASRPELSELDELMIRNRATTETLGIGRTTQAPDAST
jgi:hypothetical protein